MGQKRLEKLDVELRNKCTNIIIDKDEYEVNSSFHLNKHKLNDEDLKQYKNTIYYHCTG